MASKLPETKLQNEKGLKLYCRYWNEDEQQEKTDIKGLVLIVHGYCEHCLFYTELAELLKKQGFYVFSHDHVGHGQSDGDRAHIHSFDEWGVAMLDALMRIKSSFPEIQWPFLILHGTKDALCELEGSQLMYDKASSTDKKLKRT
ncbi:MGLL-like protein [Mya arenaria]|uniref:MGLL-like protein n=1 Tax=Mya arenaria TaxID=6604 RepID=A0ABY7FW58_MYAAR|nr:MGLL-like protein [Mya arenaria]